MGKTRGQTRTQAGGPLSTGTLCLWGDACAHGTARPGGPACWRGWGEAADEDKPITIQL